MRSILRGIAGCFKRLFQTKCCRQISREKVQYHNIMKSADFQPFICDQISSIADVSRKQQTEYSYKLLGQMNCQERIVMETKSKPKDKKKQYVLSKELMKQILKEIQLSLHDAIYQDDGQYISSKRSIQDQKSQNFEQSYLQDSSKVERRIFLIDRNYDSPEKHINNQQNYQEYNKDIQKNAKQGQVYIFEKKIHTQTFKSTQNRQCRQRSFDYIHKTKKIHPHYQQYQPSRSQNIHLRNHYENPSDYLIKKHLKLRIYVSYLSDRYKLKLKNRFRRIFKNRQTEIVHFSA